LSKRAALFGCRDGVIKWRKRFTGLTSGFQVKTFRYNKRLFIALPRKEIYQ